MTTPEVRLVVEVGGEPAYEFKQHPDRGGYIAGPIGLGLSQISAGDLQRLAFAVKYLLECVGAKELRQALTAAEAASKPQENSSP